MFLGGVSEAKTFHLSVYSSILDLRSNVLYDATVQSVTFYLKVFSYTSVLPLEMNANDYWTPYSWTQ